MPRLVPPVVPSGRLADIEPPVIEASAPLVLRPWCADDAPVLVRAFEDPEIRRWHVNVVDDQDEARAWIESCGDRWRAETNASWAVVESRAGGLGCVAIRGIDLPGGEAECSYWVLPEGRGRRVAATATDRMAAWAFGELASIG